ncbi:MAG: uroporphyrinogen-III C-methyltransferase [Zetaproteobacteria bacterium]|nr:uroporphyrinogen-III C-methyltransferase [Zetaproteobacteria bacterium]
MDGKDRAPLLSLSAPLEHGEVALVGAGPGAADLLTLAAARLLAACDVVVHDALVSDGVLQMASPAAALIFAGKRGGRASTAQSDISALMIEMARAGKRVVRLKGGDSFVFGRGGEEVRALAAAGIKFRVIPGVTSGVAAPAMAGISVTDREVNASLAFLTGHEVDAKSRIDWKALVEAFPVLVLYMAAKNLSKVARELRNAGLSAATPVAAIYAATLPEEHYSQADLETAAQGNMAVQSPTIVVIGDVVSQRVAWR